MIHTGRQRRTRRGRRRSQSRSASGSPIVARPASMARPGGPDQDRPDRWRDTTEPPRGRFATPVWRSRDSRPTDTDRAECPVPPSSRPPSRTARGCWRRPGSSLPRMRRSSGGWRSTGPTPGGGRHPGQTGPRRLIGGLNQPGAVEADPRRLAAPHIRDTHLRKRPRCGDITSAARGRSDSLTIGRGNGKNPRNIRVPGWRYADLPNLCFAPRHSFTGRGRHNRRTGIIGPQGAGQVGGDVVVAQVGRGGVDGVLRDRPRA